MFTPIRARRCGLIWVGALLLGVLSGPTVAQAGWRAPFALSAVTHVDRVDAAVDDRGEAIVAWDTLAPSTAGSGHLRGLVGRPGRFPARGTELLPQRLYDNGFELRTNPRGDATVSWEGTNGNVDLTDGTTERAAGGAFGRPNPLERETFEWTDALNDAGDRAVIFAPPTGSIRAAQRPTGTRRFSPGQALTSGIDVSPDGDSPPLVELTRSGDAIAVWSGTRGDHRRKGTTMRPEREVIEASFGRHGASFGAPQRLATYRRATNDKLSPFDHPTPRLAVSPAGDAVAVWRRNGRHSVVYAAYRRRGVRRFGPAHPLSAGTRNAYGPRVSIADDGSGVVVWQRDGGTHAAIQAARVSSRGRFGHARTVSSDGYEIAIAPQLVLNPLGDAVISWTSLVPAGRPGAGRYVGESSRSAGRSFSGPRRLTYRGGRSRDATIALDERGAVIAIWRDPSLRTIDAATGPSGGQLDATVLGPQAPSNGFDPPPAPVLASAPNGTAVALWGSGRGRGGPLRSAVRLPRGSFTTTNDLAGEIVAGQPIVAINRAGRAFAMWPGPERKSFTARWRGAYFIP